MRNVPNEEKHIITLSIEVWQKKIIVDQLKTHGDNLSMGSIDSSAS